MVSWLKLIFCRWTIQFVVFSKERQSPNTADHKEQKKREKQRLEKEKKEQKEREKKENEMKKKFKVSWATKLLTEDLNFSLKELPTGTCVLSYAWHYSHCRLCALGDWWRGAHVSCPGDGGEQGSQEWPACQEWRHSRHYPHHQLPQRQMAGPRRQQQMWAQKLFVALLFCHVYSVFSDGSSWVLQTGIFQWWTWNWISRKCSSLARRPKQLDEEATLRETPSALEAGVWWLPDKPALFPVWIWIWKQPFLDRFLRFADRRATLSLQAAVGITRLTQWH